MTINWAHGLCTNPCCNKVQTKIERAEKKNTNRDKAFRSLLPVSEILDKYKNLLGETQAVKVLINPSAIFLPSLTA